MTFIISVARLSFSSLIRLRALRECPAICPTNVEISCDCARKPSRIFWAFDNALSEALLSSEILLDNASSISKCLLSAFSTTRPMASNGAVIDISTDFTRSSMASCAFVISTACFSTLCVNLVTWLSTKSEDDFISAPD